MAETGLVAKSSVDGVTHSVLHHCIDVALVACNLAGKKFNNRTAQALGLLAGLHDVGKVGDSFQRAVDETIPRNRRRSQARRHWELSEILLRDNDDLLKHIHDNEQIRQQIYASVAGHHGKAPDMILSGRHLALARKQIGNGSEAGRHIIAALVSLFPEARLDIDVTPDFSFLAAGLTVVADYMTFNTDWFPHYAGGVSYDISSLDEYRAKRLPLVEPALEQAGMLVSAIRNERLFSFEDNELQSLCRNIVIDEKPSLFMIEGGTGSGKTEAAFILVQRLMNMGLGRGLYFAMPTTATTDRMFSRMTGMAGKLMEKPTVALMHGRKGYNDQYQTLKERGGPDSDIRATEWLSDGHRSLLSDIGVGTIDQVLRMVIPSRHMAIRHYGLHGKILVVDEIHELGDAYMIEEIVALLKRHRASGGSTIIMTATLPLSLKRKIMDAYDDKGDEVASNDMDRIYPALTVAGRTPVPFSCAHRSIKVVQETKHDRLLEQIDSDSKRGCCCLWIRNTVNAAIRSCRDLQARGIRTKLLHSRYTLGDRKEIERDIFESLKDDDARRGLVVISTQIIESSIDVDFDTLYTDLAPVVSLIQRSGRLWRHERKDRPVSEPVMRMLVPDGLLRSLDKWLGDDLAHAGAIYDPSVLWRTMKMLAADGPFGGVMVMPENTRSMMENSLQGPVPPIIEEASLLREQQQAKARNTARSLILGEETWYRQTGCDVPDGEDADTGMEFQTRLMESVEPILIMKRNDDGTFTPHNKTYDESLVSVRSAAWWKYGPVNDAEIETVKKFIPARYRKGKILVVDPANADRKRAMDYHKEGLVINVE